MSRSKAALILAAGLGTRMRSKRIKVLHEVAGLPMIFYPIRIALALGMERIVLVLGHQREAVEAAVRAAFPQAPIEIAVQAEQLGTAHAVSTAREALDGFKGDVYILSGDVPAMPVSVIEALDACAGTGRLAVVGMRLPEPAAYGRLIIDGDHLMQIVEAKDCSVEQLSVCEVNAGIYRVDCEWLFPALQRLGNDNAQGEFYLTDLVAIAAEDGEPARVVVLEDDAAHTVHGVNDRVDLARTEAVMQQQLRTDLMRQGVTLIDPSSVWLHADVTVGADTVLEPGVSLLNGTRIGEDCVVGQGSRLRATQVADGTHLRAFTHTENAVVGPQAVVGPFARLREGTVLAERVKIGNFVETKKVKMGPGAKASHLSYLGDAEIGAAVNIGAGTITCNYDGKNKFKTVIEDGAFIGSDTQLVAPVRVGQGAFVGAGSTVTETVPAGALALTRVRQRNIDGWVARKAKKDA